MRRSQQEGFTLVEMIMVIVITGIIGGMVAVFLKAPIQQYMDVSRRADMTDIADTALRRIGRDLRLALPNSVRVTGVCGVAGTTCFIEFLPTSGGGRYRRDTPGDILNFSAADTTFEVLGTVPSFLAGDEAVIYNLGIAGANAYLNDNRAAWNGATVGNVLTIAAKQFLLESPGARFQVITTPVTYACASVAGGVGGTLTRWQNYAIQPGQPGALPVGGTSATLANNVSECLFRYEANVVAQRSGLVSMNLAITKDGETVTLYSATHVSNVP